MAKLNRTCVICNKQYKYCYSCPTDLQHPSWKTMFDEENCKNIFNILGKEGQGLITEKEAKEMLSQCDLKEKDTFADNVKQHINRVLGVKDKIETDNKDKLVEKTETKVEDKTELETKVKVETEAKVENVELNKVPEKMKPKLAVSQKDKLK